jgi:hypothetical protein
VKGVTRAGYSGKRDSVTGFFFDGFGSFSMTVLDFISGLIRSRTMFELLKS